MQSDPSPSTLALTAPSEAHLGASEADRDSAGSNRPPLHRDQSSTSGRPRGILKNANPSGDAGTNNEGVRWDEVNLNLNEVEREATTRMQITEPKTPFVRYDAETDTVEDLDKIPGFELGQAERSEGDEDMEGEPSSTASGSTSASTSAQATAAARQASISSRSSSFSGSRRGSETSRRSSDVSERKMVVVEDHGPGVDAEDEGADEETRQAKKEFKERRGSHYSGEGEMMKRFRAGILELDDEDEDESAVAVDKEDEEEDDDEDMQTGEDGHAQANGQTGRREKKGRRIPPVPPLPNGTA